MRKRCPDPLKRQDIFIWGVKAIQYPEDSTVSWVAKQLAKNLQATTEEMESYVDDVTEDVDYVTVYKATGFSNAENNGTWTKKFTVEDLKAAKKLLDDCKPIHDEIVMYAENDVAMTKLVDKMAEDMSGALAMNLNDLVKKYHAEGFHSGNIDL